MLIAMDNCLLPQMNGWVEGKCKQLLLGMEHGNGWESECGQAFISHLTPTLIDIILGIYESHLLKKQF